MSDDVMNVIHDVVYKVREYCPGPVGWIAKQSVSDNQPYDDLFGFVIGKGFASVRLVDARNIDDELIRALATEILGFPPDSPQDIQRRLAEADQHLREHDATIEKLNEQRAYWAKVKASLEVKIVGS